MDSTSEDGLKTNNSSELAGKTIEKMPQEYSNGDVGVKIETEETSIVDIDFDQSVPPTSADAPDSTVSIEEGSGDEKKEQTGRAKRKAALNIRQFKESDTDSDTPIEDGYTDPSFEPQLIFQAGGSGLRESKRGRPPKSKRGRPGRPPRGERDAKVPKLQIRSDIAAREETYISFVCEWGLCEQQFLAIGDCWEHLFSCHLRDACVPNTDTLRFAVRCQWKGCSRLKRCSLPFSKFSYLTRHVTEAHPLRSKQMDQSGPY